MLASSSSLLKHADVTPELFCGKQHNSAFMGAKLTGRATDTVVAGKHVLKDCKLA